MTMCYSLLGHRALHTNEALYFIEMKTGMGTSIFISYRRVDSSDVTGRIYDRLVATFDRNSVFKDVDSIPFGVDFREHLDGAVSQCQVCLVVVGRTWLEAQDEGGRRRLDSTQDFVRIEIESALKRNIPVIPVLVGGAAMPGPEQLPPSLEPLAYRNGAQVRSDPDFHRDMDRLIAGIQQHFGSAQTPPPSSLQQKQTFTFEVVTVNDKGQKISRKPGQAEYVSEPLGNGVTLDLVKIPGGTFQMGSIESEKEKPIHSVTVDPFWLGKFPVTQEQYEAVMGTNPSNFKGAKRPAETVSWNDAVALCQCLSEKLGNQYRLPSEAEWEYACRAGTTTPFYFGVTLTSDLANYNGTTTYTREPKGKYREQTTDVGTFSPNGFGLYDMHGNVWEWCADHWHENYQGTPTDGSAWLSKNDNDNRLLRGGGWNSDPRPCCSAYRNNNTPVNRFNNLGFRVVCDSSRTL
jgi:formylglycine-generating enzyme required for sulfatase activity